GELLAERRLPRLHRRIHPPAGEACRPRDADDGDDDRHPVLRTDAGRRRWRAPLVRARRRAVLGRWPPAGPRRARRRPLNHPEAFSSLVGTASSSKSALPSSAKRNSAAEVALAFLASADSTAGSLFATSAKTNSDAEMRPRFVAKRTSAT